MSDDRRTAPSTWIEPVTWHASLPGAVVSAGALISNGDGRVLIVKPNYRDHWTLPGGICDFREPPAAGCAREVKEELGLARPTGRLLSVDWQVPLEIYGSAARPVVFFIFDGGILDSLDGITLQAEELDECQFVAEGEVDPFLPPAAVPRVRAAIAARTSGVGYGPGLMAGSPL